jgi:hypothetical protein
MEEEYTAVLLPRTSVSILIRKKLTLTVKPLHKDMFSYTPLLRWAARCGKGPKEGIEVEQGAVIEQAGTCLLTSLWC